MELFSPTMSLELRREGERWFTRIDHRDYPAKASRAEDLLKLLASRASYQKAGSGGRAISALGLGEDQAGRITLWGGAGPPMLDLLIGLPDASGRERYLRRREEEAIYVGEDRFYRFLDSPEAWQDLRLFPDHGGENDLVQRIIAEPEGAAPYVLVREGAGWKFDGDASFETVNSGLVESYLRTLLGAEGERFITAGDIPELPASPGIRLELGNGETLTLKLGPELREGRRMVQSSGTPYAYELAGWGIGRLFRDSASFLETHH